MAQQERGNGRGKRQRKAPANSLRVRIVAACVQREVTPREIADREQVDIAVVGYYFRDLEKEGYLRVSRKEQARGFKRNYYVANRQRLILDQEFGQMAPDAQYEVSAAVLRDFLVVCRDSLHAGTLDARDDSHLSWSPFALDMRGWKDMMGELMRTFERAREIQAESTARIRKSGEEPIPTVISLAGFEGPPPKPHLGRPQINP